MILQVKVIEKIQALGTYNKRFVLTFYSKMIKDHPKLFPYDPLPHYLKNRSMKRKYNNSDPISF